MDPKLLERIIFLDFDGVLATPHSYMSAPSQSLDGYHNGLLLNRSRVQRLETIYRKTRASIVLSTTWRLLFPIAKNTTWLRKLGLTAPILGQTPDMPERTRGIEILSWLAKNAPDCQHWLAIDDDWKNMHPITDDHLIRTYWSPPKGKPVGLSRGHIEEAIKKLEVACPSTNLSLEDSSSPS